MVYPSFHHMDHLGLLFARKLGSPAPVGRSGHTAASGQRKPDRTVSGRSLLSSRIDLIGRPLRDEGTARSRGCGLLVEQTFEPVLRVGAVVKGVDLGEPDPGVEAPCLGQIAAGVEPQQRQTARSAVLLELVHQLPGDPQSSTVLTYKQSGDYADPILAQKQTDASDRPSILTRDPEHATRSGQIVSRKFGLSGHSCR
jgi:hypothetical protein